MKKYLILILLILISACHSVKREDYYIFSFNDYTLSVGYDDVEFLELTFYLDVKDELEPQESVEDITLYSFNIPFAEVDVCNTGKKADTSDKATVTRFKYYLDDFPMESYQIDGITLSSSIKENCDTFGGEYIDRNGKACLFGKKVDGKDNVVLLQGDMLNIDQDQLESIEIYVK
ncbi:MAG: hypothetical protein IJI77_03940 [Erysipelotrichaceae bacterium]|nr:hypothetical protein [Erysipelotrichaceae bacterium]